jgi:hypothetical protein
MSGWSTDTSVLAADAPSTEAASFGRNVHVNNWVPLRG